MIRSGCDGSRSTFSRSRRTCTVTVREYDLLVHLMATPGTAHSRRALMTDVWGWDYGDEATVTVHVRRLREKVERDPSQPERITTVWGVGYRWDGAP